MAIRKLKDIQREVEELSAAEQVELAQYLLAKAKSQGFGEEAILTEALLAKGWLRPEEDRAWASL